MKHKPLPKWPWDWDKFHKWKNAQQPKLTRSLLAQMYAGYMFEQTL